jgi:hypothetical protein
MRHVLELRFGLTGSDRKTLEKWGRASASRASASGNSKRARSRTAARRPDLELYLAAD